MGRKMKVQNIFEGGGQAVKWPPKKKVEAT
jgi:hypothetical protein